jgi:hypothetical protein
MKTKLGKRHPNYSQGEFKPKNINKYRGSFPVFYRSGLELKVMRWFDDNSNVISWGSESVVIPYYSPLDEKSHRYFVDFIVNLKSRDGSLKKLLIEVKPHKQTLKPTISPNKKPTTVMYENRQYILNQVKWEAAKEWAQKKGYEFLVLTEKNINP